VNLLDFARWIVMLMVVVNTWIILHHIVFICILVKRGLPEINDFYYINFFSKSILRYFDAEFLERNNFYYDFLSRSNVLYFCAIDYFFRLLAVLNVSNVFLKQIKILAEIKVLIAALIFVIGWLIVQRMKIVFSKLQLRKDKDTLNHLEVFHNFFLSAIWLVTNIAALTILDGFPINSSDINILRNIVFLFWLLIYMVAIFNLMAKMFFNSKSTIFILLILAPLMSIFLYEQVKIFVKIAESFGISKILIAVLIEVIACFIIQLVQIVFRGVFTKLKSRLDISSVKLLVSLCALVSSIIWLLTINTTYSVLSGNSLFVH